MFSKKTLMIPDLITKNDIPKVYNYFDYFDIAKLNNVTYYDHNEEEFYSDDKSHYGYVIIEVEEWNNNNNSSKYFYEAICENKGKMIYEDPYYWNVLFYDSEEVTNDNCNNVKCIVNSDSESTNFVEHTYENNCCNVDDNNKVKLEIKLNSSDEDEEVEVKDEDEEDEVEEVEVKDEDEEVEEVEELDDEEVDEEVKDENYVFGEDETNDFKDKFYKKYDYSFDKNKKRKYSKIIENLKAENNDLRELLIKKTKKYKKNDKFKDNNFSWYRRLRVKVVE
tara:strand:- start:1861 stop:2697 length:837 start_codon:yes stop_codon:yes gene_type:complete